MRALKPRHAEGRVFLILAVIQLLLAAVFPLFIGFETLTGCSINEGGVGTCVIGGIDVMQPVTVIALLAILSVFFVTPFCLMGMLVTGLISLFRRRW